MSTFLKAEWRKLILANYNIDPAILLPLLPAKTELDFFQDKCYVSLVGFMFLNTRVLGIKIPWHINFEEVNLRFYVRHHKNGEWKRGVVFHKEIVPRRAISFVANTLYGEKYETLPMKHLWEETADELHVSYQWKKESWNSIAVKCSSNSETILPDSEEEFITEHYWGYSKISENKTSEYEVGHPKWTVYPMRSYHIDVDFEMNYGARFGFLNGMEPVSVFLAEGSEIFVRKGLRF